MSIYANERLKGSGNHLIESASERKRREKGKLEEPDPDEEYDRRREKGDNR